MRDKGVMMNLDPTPIKDIKPQLLCLGQLLGMDLYIDIQGEHPDNYDIAQKLYQRMLKSIEPSDTIAMTGSEWYEKFKKEYHMRADWISADPEMGDDAEHDVLLAARLASGIEEEK